MDAMVSRADVDRTGPRTRVAPRSATLQRRMQLAVGALRGVTLGWSAVVCAVDASSGVLTRPASAAVLLVVLAAWSVLWTVAVGRRDRWVSGPAGIVVDVLLACLAVAADPVLYDGSHPQSFASAWPLAAVIATGIGAGAGWGLAGGLVVGATNLAATAVTGGIEGRWLSTLGTSVLLGAAGWVSGWVARQLRTTAQAAADAQAREEFTATLHDGVLQTLAVIQRRSGDEDLVALAREQDAELRAFLRGETTGAPGSGRVTATNGLVEELARTLGRIERRDSITTRLVVIDPGTAEGESASALVGATSEAVVNVAKHAHVDEVWVSVDRRRPSGTMVVVHDEGTGFDPAVTPAGTGTTSSILVRLRAVGGDATIESTPGRGTDVTLWVP